MKSVNTINDIAKIAGVSKSTVSRALNNSSLISKKTRDEIQAIAKEHNFTLHKGAQNLSLQKSRTIALVSPLGVEEDYSINDPYFTELLKGVIEATTKLGYDLLIGRPHKNSPEEVLSYIDSSQTAGVILVGCGVDNSIKKQIGRKGVITTGADTPENLCSVDCDNLSGGFLATNHLIQRGCRKIGFIGGSLYGAETELRLSGYKNALKDAQIPFDDSLVSFGNFTGKSGFDRMSEWLTNSVDVDGLFAGSDLMAIGAIEALRKHNLVAGKDIAVVGFDDISLAEYCSPPLTTVRQNIQKIGATLVDNLVKNIDDGIITKAILPVELVVRQSA